MMPSLKHLSIRKKLPLIVMFSSGVSLLLACGVFLFYDQANARRTLERDLSVLAEIVSAQSAAAVAFDDRKAAEEIISALAAERQVVFAAVIAADGRPLALHPRGHPPPPPRLRDGLHYEGDELVLARPIVQERRRIGTFYARSDLGEVRSHFKQAVGVVLLILAASTIAALALSFKLGAMITRPVLNLAETMRTVSAAGNYDLRAAPAGRDEVGRLIEGFNEMLSQIRARDAALEGKVREVTETQGRLSVQRAELGTYHDLVTHDVTNFAGTLMIIVERLLSRRDGELVPKQQELLRRANRQIFKLNQLSANAKTLARLREKGLPPVGGPVRLAPLLGHVIETVRAVHFDRAFEARVECAEPIQIADIPFIENVFMNLVDNALCHTPLETAPVLRVLARQRDHEVSVWVRGGKPSDEASRGRLFDRYVRGPHSTGAGLGLFVVRAIVERAGGRVALGTAGEPEGAVFEVALTLPGA
jgi:signal transduction histidine kinase